MNKEMNFEEIMDFEQEHETYIYMYEAGEFGETGELIKGFKEKHLADISIDYKNKIFHAKYIGDGSSGTTNGIENGKIFDIPFYKMEIV